MGLAALALSAPAFAEAPDIAALLKAVDDANREESSSSTMTMQVKTSRYERSMTMEMWSSGAEKALIRIVEPAKDRGVATLKVDDNLWNYLPKVDRTMKVPSAMMSGAWMGSHLSNDDLVRESRFSDDYACTMAGTRTVEEREIYDISCTPHPDTPVVWGKVTVSVRADLVPLEQVFYDEDGEKIRTLSFEDIHEVGGKQVAMIMRVTPHDKPGEFTLLTFDKLSFDPVDDNMFSLQTLKK